MCGTSQTSTNTSQSYSPQVAANANSLYNSAAGYASANPYNVYSGPTSAAATPGQTQATNYASNNLGQTNPYTTQAAGYTQSVANSINPNESIASLINPYAQSALAPTIQSINDTAAQQTGQAGANAAMNGAFGGSAQGVAQGQIDRYQQQNVGNATATGMNTAYNAAQSQQNQNLANLLSSGNQLSGIGQNAYSQGTGLASLLGSLGAQQQGIAQQGITNAMTVNQQANTGQLGQDATLQSILSAGAPLQGTTGNSTTTQPDNAGLALLGALL